MTTSVPRASDGGGGEARARLVAVEIGGRRHEITVHAPAPAWAETARRHRARSKGLTGESSEAVVSPMQGTVLSLAVADGQRVEAGALICVVEAMKMENEILAHRAGVVTGLAVAPGAQVTSGQLICLVEPGG